MTIKTNSNRPHQASNNGTIQVSNPFMVAGEVEEGEKFFRAAIMRMIVALGPFRFCFWNNSKAQVNASWGSSSLLGHLEDINE
jgi:hypothetical protein